jgi:histidine triad (HIT) family protein
MSDAVAACLFCKFATGAIKPAVVHETASVLAFKDINPQAPTHVLIIPKRHVATLNDLVAGDAALMGELMLAAKQVAADAGLAESGYRVAINCGAGAGQSVFHVHLHLLGGRRLSWPPG